MRTSPPRSNTSAVMPGCHNQYGLTVGQPPSWLASGKTCRKATAAVESRIGPSPRVRLRPSSEAGDVGHSVPVMSGRCSGRSRTYHCAGIATIGGSVVVEVLDCGDVDTVVVATPVVSIAGAVAVTGAESACGDVEHALDTATTTQAKAATFQRVTPQVHHQRCARSMNRPFRCIGTSASPRGRRPREHPRACVAMRRCYPTDCPRTM